MQVSTPSSKRMTEKMAAPTCSPAWMPAQISWVLKPPVRPLQTTNLNTANINAAGEQEMLVR